MDIVSVKRNEGSETEPFRHVLRLALILPLGCSSDKVKYESPRPYESYVIL